MLITRPFSEQIREESMADHRSAEDSRFITSLMQGSLSVEQYGVYLSQFQAIYAVLDRANRQLSADSRFCQFSDPRLARTDAISADLAAMGVEPQPATAATELYTARLDWAGQTSNLRVVAHHYTRYLGDLSGGRIIATRLAKLMDLSPSHGLTFYEFSDLGKLPKYKQRYREQLDALCLDLEEREILIEEVRLAYQLNSEVFRSLEAFL